MNTMQFTLWTSLLVTPIVLNGVGSSKLTLKMPERQTVAVGHTVVLTSWISQNVTPISISWFKENVGQLLLYTDHKVILEEAYQNHVGLMHSPPRNDFSMYINNTNLLDSGRYTCSVAILVSQSNTIVSGATKLDVLSMYYDAVIHSKNSDQDE
ncbi:endothelial cell adhesion molecule a [Mustelus asterias]